MSRKKEKQQFHNRHNGSKFPSPDFPRRDQLIPSDMNLRRVTNTIKQELVRNGGDTRINVIAPIGIATGVLGYYVGPTGTQEYYEMPFGRRSFEMYVADETIAYFGRNRDELRASMISSGVLSQEEARMLDTQARRGNIQQVQTMILTRLGQVHEAILQRPNPRESLLVQMLSRLPQDAAQKVEENSGQLIAMCYLEAAKKGIPFLSTPDLTPQEVKTDSVLYNVRTALTKPLKTITVPVESPKTLFVAGPGTSTAGSLSDFLKFPKSVYADKSRFIASIISSLSTYNGKSIGPGIDRYDVVSRSNGMDNAAEEFSGQIYIAQFSMVHSAPPEVIETTLNTLGKKMKQGAILIALLPDKVYPSETTFQVFSEEAQDAGLARAPFMINGEQVFEHSYSHPNITPGWEIPDRKAFIGIYRKP